MSVLHSAVLGRTEEQCKRLDEVIYERLVSDQEASCDNSVDYGSYEELQQAMGTIQVRCTQALEDALARAVPQSAEEEEAMREYVETQKKSKFLFDGNNMIKIRPKKVMAVKALLGKAYLTLRTRDSACGETRQTPSANEGGCAMRRTQRARNTESACGYQAEESSEFNGTLADFESENGIIPLLVEVVCDRLLSEDVPARGLFLKTADFDVVNQMKLDFRRGFIPENIDCVDGHVLATLLISFLKDLQAPLIPSMFRSVFTDAVKVKCPQERERALRECVALLPDVNRLTLAKICETVQWVVANKNPLIAYAKIFAPMFVGYAACPQMDRNREFAVMVETTMALLSLDQTNFEVETGY